MTHISSYVCSICFNFFFDKYIKRLFNIGELDVNFSAYISNLLNIMNRIKNIYLLFRNTPLVCSWCFFFFLILFTSEHTALKYHQFKF